MFTTILNCLNYYDEKAINLYSKFDKFVTTGLQK